MLECSATSNLKLFQVNQVLNIRIASILREVKLISEFLIPYNKIQCQLPGEILKFLPHKTYASFNVQVKYYALLWGGVHD